MKQEISFPLSDREFNQKVASDRMFSGMTAEASAIADLYGRGYRVSKPFDGASPYDLIVDLGDWLAKLQVKLMSRSNQARFGWTTYRMTHADGGKSYYKPKVVHRYNDKSFDFLVGVDRDTHVCYYVPVDDLDWNKDQFSFNKENREKYSRF